MNYKRGSLESQEKIYQKFINCNVPAPTAKKAVTNLAKNLNLIAISGKMGSGKDTVGVRVMTNLAKDNWTQLSFASAIKSDLNQVITICRESNDIKTALNRAVSEGFAEDLIKIVIELLFKESKDLELDAYTRTPVIRETLQYWGKAMRERKGETWWSNILVMQIATGLAESKSILVSDARFPHEMDLCKELGFTTIRLEVDSSEQKTRLKKRDGITTPLALLNDLSETALDNYLGFDLKISSSDKNILDKILSKVI
jgi:dephospho-CoA kinase